MIKSFENYIVIKTDNLTTDKCLDFAEDCYKSNKDEYKRRGQCDKWAIIQQIFIGKIAEYGVYNYLCDKSMFQMLSPDLVIYDKGNKSYDADLFFNGFNIHVKSQDERQVKTYGRSYLLQKNDPITIAPKLSDIACFTSVIPDIHNVLVHGFITCNRLIKWLGTPKKEALRATKHAIYLSEDMNLRSSVVASLLV